MARQFLVAIGAMWLMATSVWAPFAHIHPGDPGHHHDNGFAHPHFGHPARHDHESEGAEFEENDHDEIAVWTDWAPTVEPRFEIPVADVANSFVLAPIFITEGVAPQYTVRSHDPPALLYLPARAPPA
jgi:hypothetical protein